MLKNHKFKIISVFFFAIFLISTISISALLVVCDLILYFKLQSFAFVFAGVALMVVTVPHPVFSVLYLVLLFLLGAIFCLSLGLEYMGLVLLVVYVGAIAVLFLFVVMMLDIKVANKRYISHYRYQAKQIAILFFLPILKFLNIALKFVWNILIPWSIMFYARYPFDFYSYYINYDIILKICMDYSIYLSKSCSFRINRVLSSFNRKFFT